MTMNIIVPKIQSHIRIFSIMLVNICEHEMRQFLINVASDLSE